jgi:hypothetical protein
MVRLLALGLLGAASAGLAVAMLVSTACVTAPPPELPQQAVHRPTILRESVVPPAGLILPDLPLEFIVPVELEDPSESFQWDVFIDYNACVDSSCTPTQPLSPVVTVTPTPGTLDGGVELVSFSAPKGLDPSRCHTIDFLVAHQFLQGFPHQPDAVGGDIATWTYDPGGAIPCSDLVYDAGSLQDGAFPPADAGSEALPAVPESGTD